MLHDNLENRERRTIDSMEDIYACYSASEWQMEHAERLAMIALLRLIRPRCSIEIGCQFGGSTSVLAYYSNHVFTLDINPAVVQRVSTLGNVRAIIGNSKETFPALLSRMEEHGKPIDFVLIDGDHTTEGVYSDCQSTLTHHPRSTIFVLMHDSANPSVRAGILKASWKKSEFVQFLDLDFVPGKLRSRKDIYKQIWGGFALAILSEKSRPHELEIQSELDLTWSIVMPHSVYGERTGESPSRRD